MTNKTLFKNSSSSTPYHNLAIFVAMIGKANCENPLAGCFIFEMGKSRWQEICLRRNIGIQKQHQIAISFSYSLINRVGKPLIFCKLNYFYLPKILLEKINRIVA